MLGTVSTTDGPTGPHPKEHTMPRKNQPTTATADATATTATVRKGIGNTPVSSGPVVPANLSGVVTETVPPRKTAAELKATMEAKTAAAAERKAAEKATAKTTTKATATKTVSEKAAAAKAERDAAKAKTAEEVLAWLTAHAGTAYAVRDVELGTGNGPETDRVKTLRPTLWALVEKGLVTGNIRTEAGRKGFMVEKAVPARKTAAKTAAAKTAAK